MSHDVGLRSENSAGTRYDARRRCQYRHGGNPPAAILLLGHSKIESTVRYLGIEVDDAIEIAEKIDI